MKPKTVKEKEVMQLSKELPKLTKEHINWADVTTLYHYGLRTQKETVCWECGKSFHTSEKKTKCPKCGMELEILDSRKLKDRHQTRFTIVTTYKGYQLFRVFLMDKFLVKYKKAVIITHELSQTWIKEGHQTLTHVAHLFHNSYYSRYESCYSDFEIRQSRAGFGVYYPKMELLPILKKRGFTIKKYKDRYPVDHFIHMLLNNNKLETLYKVHKKFFDHYWNYSARQLNRVWPAIKMCLRHKYEPKYIHDWNDLIELLLHYKKDIHNPILVCPKDFDSLHNFYVRKKQKEFAKMEKKKQIEKMMKEEEEFLKLKSKYLNKEFTNGNVTIKTLDTIEEYIAEGEALHHCVHAGNYHLKKDSLILSARRKSTILETIELDLKARQVVQARGLMNKNSRYHKEILELMNKNINLICKPSRKLEVA